MTQQLYAAAVTPSYALSEPDNYTPWMLGHADPRQLDPEVLQPIFADWFKHENPHDWLMDDFMEHLESLGYVVWPTQASGIVVLDTSTVGRH